MPRVIRKLEPVEPPDGRGWAVWTLLVALAAGVAWVVWTKADFADPMPWRNGWVLLAGLALTTAALVWASLRLKGRNMRRFQVGVLVSLLLHLWGAVAMERLSLALSIVPPAETEREAPTPNLAPAQEYYIEAFVPPTVEATPEQTEYERPVATQTPEAEAAEVPRQEQETTPNRSEALAASQAELSSTVEPSPAEMSRAAEAAARRSPDTGQLSRREATSATVAGEAAEAPPVEQPQQFSPRPDAAPAELQRTATASARAPAQPTTNDSQRPSASAPSAARAVAQDAPQTRDASPAASRAAAAAAAPEIAAADVESAAAAEAASSDQPGAASTALARQATGGAAPNAIATSESSQPAAAASLARAATAAAGAPQVSAGGAASARAAAGGAASQTAIEAPALAGAAEGGGGPQAQSTALGQSAPQIAGAAGGMIGAAAGDSPAAGAPAAMSAAGRSSAAPSVAAAASAGGARAAASGAVAGAAADAPIPGDSNETAAAVAQGPAGTAVGRESTSLASTAAATQIGAGGSPGLSSPTALARAASGQGDAAQPSAALGSQAAVGRSVVQADLPSQAAPGDEGPAAADQAAGVPEALAPASGGGLGRLASSGPAAGSANAAADGLNPSPGQPLATGSPQAAVGALSPGVSLGGGSAGRLGAATSISSRAAELADPAASLAGGGGAGAPAPTATAIGRAGGSGAAQPAASGFAGSGGGGPAAGSSGLARSSGAAAGGPQTAAVGGGSGRRAAASAAGAIDPDAAAPDVGEAATAESVGPAAAQVGLARAETGAPSDLGGGPASPNSGASPGALLGGGPSRATASSSAGPAVAAGGSGSGGRRTASALPSEMIAEIPDEGGPAAADGTAGGAPAPGDQPDRRTSGRLPVQVAAVDGPGGLGPQASANAGVPNRLARSDSNLIQANTGRFLRRDAGAPQAIDTRALDSAAPFAGRQRGGNLPPGANPGAAGGRTERAIELGLDFLARHQSNDGRWSLHNYAQGREGYPNEADAKALRSDSAATGLALLAFLGAGYDHVTGDRHQPVVAKGLDYLVGQQQNNGDLYVREDAKSNESAWLYSHAIATIALCEAYGMTGDVKLREPAQRAIDFAVASQHKTLGGWRYRPGFEADTSVTGWMLMALKSGELAGLDVPQESYQRVRKWLDSAQANLEGQYVYNPQAPDTAERRQGREPSNTMTAVGLLMRLYLGKNREDPELARGAEVLVRNLPDLGTYASRSRDTYYWYYATQVMFHMRGDHWKRWNERLHPLLVGSQLQRGPLAGSWDPRRPVPDRWGPQAGRIYVTTMNLLSLEVTYRHLPIYDSTAQ